MNEEQKQALGQIKAMINEWRKNKKNHSEKMPDDIWEVVFNFIETTQCSDNEVLREIGIKSKQLSNRRKSLGLAQSVQKNLSMKTDLKPSNENKLTQFEITRPDGLTIKFQAPMAELKNILI